MDVVCCRQLGTEGLKHIVHVFPNLTGIGMITESGLQPMVPIDSFVEISQLRKLELVDLSGLDHITADQAEALERAIRAQQELGLLQPTVRLRLPKRFTYNSTCFHLRTNSSHQQVFDKIEPYEILDVAIERYWRRQRVKAAAKLLLHCYIPATFVKAAFRCVAKVSRVL